MFTKMTESCTRRFLQSNIVMEKRKKALTKTANPPSECCHLCNYFFFNVKKKASKYGAGESPYSYRQIRRLPLTAPSPLVHIYNPKLAQVSLFACQR